MIEETDPPTARILIVEDEMLVSMLLEDLLDDLGYEIVGPAAELESALALARDEALDGAVLDLNLNGKPTFAVAALLRERDIPFVFATGYGIDGLPSEFGDTPVLTKPFRRNELDRAVSAAIGRN